MKISITELRELMEKIVASKYYDTAEAAKIVDILLYAELSGKNTQGVVKLLGTEPAQGIQPKHKPTIEERTELSALVNGGGSAGPLPAQIAVDKAIEIANKKGFTIVGMNNTFSSVGVIGYYARKMAQNDLIGIVAANSPKAVLQFGGIDPLYGTNPIAFGFPSQTHPIVFDMAASAITWYGLVRAKALGQPIPENVAIDHEGNLTTDPEAAMGGAILPFDRSYKGSGLAMTVELLAGVLTGAGFSLDDADWGTTFIAISPNLLMDTEEFKKRSSELVTTIKNSRPSKGSAVHVPGYDNEALIQERINTNEIEIEDKLLADLRRIIA